MTEPYAWMMTNSGEIPLSKDDWEFVTEALRMRSYKPEFEQAIGCYSHNCIFVDNSKNMGVGGPCRCIPDWNDIKWGMVDRKYYQKFRMALYGLRSNRND